MVAQINEGRRLPLPVFNQVIREAAHFIRAAVRATQAAVTLFAFPAPKKKTAKGKPELTQLFALALAQDANKRYFFCVTRVILSVFNDEMQQNGVRDSRSRTAEKSVKKTERKI